MAKSKRATPEPKPEKAEPKGFWGYVRSIGPAVAIALSIRAFLFEPFSIPSGSMLPTLQIGDYVIVTKFAYGIRVPFTNAMLWQRKAPARGDVVVFDHPRKPGEDLIKRIVGLPGEEVRLIDGVVTIDGVVQPRRLLTEDFAFDDFHERTGDWVDGYADLYVERLARDGDAKRHFVLQRMRVAPTEGPYVVPADHVFVLGDNRDNSADSRAGGWFVPFGHLRGRADVIGFSWGKSGLRFDRLLQRIDSEVPTNEAAPVATP